MARLEEIHGSVIREERRRIVRGFDFGQPVFAQTSATFDLAPLLEHGGPPT